MIDNSGTETTIVSGMRHFYTLPQYMGAVRSIQLKNDRLIVTGASDEKLILPNDDIKLSMTASVSRDVSL